MLCKSHKVWVYTYIMLYWCLKITFVSFCKMGPFRQPRNLKIRIVDTRLMSVGCGVNVFSEKRVALPKTSKPRRLITTSKKHVRFPIKHWSLELEQNHMRQTTFMTSAFRRDSVLIRICINNMGTKVDEQPTITDRHLSKRYNYEPEAPYKLLFLTTATFPPTH
jgi:hypothetical protein